MNSLIDPEYLFWLAIFVMYAGDNIKFINEDELLIGKGFLYGWIPQFHSIPFSITKRNVYVSNVFDPLSIVIRTRWMTASPCAPASLRRAKRELFILESRIFPYRCISIATTLLLLIVGPLQTLRFSFLSALRSIAIPYASVLVLLLLFLAFDRRYFRFSWRTWAAMATELTICPGVVINIVRRLSLSKNLTEFDGVGFCLANSAPIEAQRLREAVDFRLSDYEVQNGDNVDFLNRIKSYRDALG